METYRRRFGIESSYRQINQARLRTSSRSPELRLLAVAIALLLRNLWALCRWMTLARFGSGRPTGEGMQTQKQLEVALVGLSTKIHAVVDEEGKSGIRSAFTSR